MEGNKQELVINIRCIISDVFRNLWIIIVTSGFIAMGTYLFAEASYSDVYTTSATYAVTAKGSSASVYTNLTTAKTIAEIMTDIFSSDTLKHMIAEDLGVDNISGTITAEMVPESTLINITVTSVSPQMAFKIIKSAIKHYPEISDYIVSNAVLDEVSGPTVPMYPSSRFEGREKMIKAFQVSFIFLVAGFAALSVLSDRIKNEKDAERRLDAKLFGVIPVEKKRFGRKSRKKSILITNFHTSFYFVEQIKVITTKMEYALKAKKVVALTSLLENEGKSTIVSNIALAMAQRGKKVLLVDADLRKPAIYKVFDMKRSGDDGGLADYINGKKTINDIISYEENLNIYTVCGRKSYKDSTEILASEKYKEFINIVKEEFDYVIIDSSPIAITADAEVIADSSDAVILIVRQNMASAAMINDAIDELSDSGCELLGFILNRANSIQAFGGYSYAGRNYAYGSRSGYGNYKKHNKEEEGDI